ncbi:hypothetical protein PG614_10265 [Riemerella anatipestifer]|uniref:hypothetical protein n=1 Tax=Riemerella anatipestifer TaxID=34085 RepID=UPI001374991F|nr:hypothetical protein [Riemerella anatipestifer]MDY3522013.1 hypothetical protein [Riemerella anatipestifer]MDY3534256.1 hypothetical protein [Riemerella anatipestifer]MDY3536330.1 hypothetical protein [Riemerella anatipestifer]
METNFTNIKERILYYTDIKGFTKEKFFEELGVTYGNFKGKAKEKALSSDILAKIVSKYPEINPEWLLTGRGEMLKEISHLEPPNWYEYDLGDNYVSKVHSEEALERVGLRIAEICNKLGMDFDKFAKFIGVDSMFLMEVISANRKTPLSLLDNIMNKVPLLKPTWVFTGKGEMFKQPQGYTTEQTPPLIAAEGKSDYSNNTEVELLRKQVELLEENRLLHQEIKQLQERINGLEQENHAIQKQLQNRAAG